MHFYRIQSLHPLGCLATVAMLRDNIKGTLYIHYLKPFPPIWRYSKLWCTNICIIRYMYDYAHLWLQHVKRINITTILTST